MTKLLYLLSLVLLVGCESKVSIKPATPSDSVKFIGHAIYIDTSIMMYNYHVVVAPIERYFLISYQAGSDEKTLYNWMTWVGDRMPSNKEITKSVKRTFPWVQQNDHHGTVITSIYEFKDSTDYNNFLK